MVIAIAVKVLCIINGIVWIVNRHKKPIAESLKHEVVWVWLAVWSSKGNNPKKNRIASFQKRNYLWDDAGG